MKTLENLQNQMHEVNLLVQQMKDESTTYAYQIAPVIIRNRLTSEFASICKNNVGKTYLEIPSAVDVMVAINVLETLYPELKN